MSRKVAGLLAAAVVALALVAGFLVLRGGDDDVASGAGQRVAPTASPVQPAPDGGDVSETVAPGKAGATVEARIDRVVRLANGVRVTVLSTRTAKVTSRSPGEGGGPAVVGRLKIENKSSNAIDVGGTMVTLLYGDDQVAQPSTAAPSAPFSGRLAPGESGRAVYVFRVPPKTKSSFSLVVQYGAGSAVARFVP